MTPDWKSYAELMGLTAVIASLVFVGLELRQSHAIAEAEMYSNTLANLIEAHNAVISNAEIWSKGNANEELSPTEEVIYGQLVAITNDRFFFSVRQQNVLGMEEFRDLDVAQFAGFLYENSRARELWRSREQRLAKYRGMVRPDERLTSEWVASIESAVNLFERTAESDR